MPGRRPLVSIVTPSLNQGRHIRNCLQSVCDQDYPEIEHIVLDGGSIDNTLEIIRQYESRLAYWVSEPDDGISFAINKGWSLAKGELLWVLNSDDVLVTPGAISALVDYLEKHPEVDFVYGDFALISESGKITGYRRFPPYDLLSLFLEERQYPFPGCLMRRRVLEQVGDLDLSLRSANDLDYFLRIAQKHRMGPLGQITAYFRVHEGSLGKAATSLSGEETIQVVKRHLCSPDTPSTVKNRAGEILSKVYGYAASCYFRDGLAQKTRSNMIRAFAYYPKKMLTLKPWAMIGLSLLGDAGMRLARTMLLRLTHYNKAYYPEYNQ